MTPSAILFGSLGTVVDTSEMQRDAFNAAFEEAGLGWYWDRQTFRTLLQGPAGHARIEHFAAQRGVTVNARALYRRKTEHFNRELAEGSVELRPGVAETVGQARSAGIPLGFATTVPRENVDAVLAATTGQLTREMFAFVGDEETISRQKPDPDIYLCALKALAVPATGAVAIADTRSCFDAARAAGIPTVVFPEPDAAPAEYDGALAVVDRLDPGLFSGG